MFTNDINAECYIKESYEELLLPINAMTYSKARDDITCRQGGSL